MDFLLIATYAALCVAVFKIFRIPLNKWTVPTAVLGGVIIIGALLLLMNYNHPYSEVVRQYSTTTPIISEVRGRVVDVPVQPHTPLKKGDILFKIDPEPFEEVIKGIQGELEAAQKDLNRTSKLYAKEVASERSVDQTDAHVDELQAKLADAQFDLEQTVITAPSDGVVAQLALHPGAMALPLRPLLTFIHQQERTFVGWFRQNSLLRLQPGDEAEVILDSLPGVILKGEVDFIVPVVGEGQMQPMADFMRYNQQTIPGRVSVAIKVTDPRLDEYKLPGGLFGQAAIYTEHFHHIAVIRKVLLRMTAWMNYVFPLH